MKSLYTGKIILTDHAKKRLRERNVDAVYVKRQLSFIPFKNKEIQKWYIPKTDLFVTYADASPSKRIIITLGRIDPNWVQTI